MQSPLNTPHAKSLWAWVAEKGEVCKGISEGAAIYLGKLMGKTLGVAPP